MTERTAIGIDVGGTKIAAALIDLATGAFLAREVIATPPGNRRADLIAEIERAVVRMRSARAVAPIGVGIGLPELVGNDGRIASAWIWDWSDFQPERELGNLGPVRLESDVRAAALGELRYGHGRQHPTMVYVTIGSGLSFALAIEGRIHRGASGFAIHFASNALEPVCGSCGAQTPFNLEDFASGLGMARVYAARTGRSDIDARAIIAGDAGPEGETLLEQATTAIASYLGQMTNMLDPDAIVIGGGLGTAPRFFDLVRGKVPSYIWAKSRRDIAILPSALGADTGVIGAAALFDEGSPWPR
jgi:glucokinase